MILWLKGEDYVTVRWLLLNRPIKMVGRRPRGAQPAAVRPHAAVDRKIGGRGRVF